MLTEIGPNKQWLYLRIAAQCTCTLLMLFFAYIIIYPKGNHFHAFLKDDGFIIKDWGLLTVFLIFNIWNFLYLIFAPFWATVDEEFRTLTIRFLMLPVKTLAVKDITAYTDITLTFKSGEWHGILLYLPNNSRIVFSEINVEDFKPVKKFLDDGKVENWGDEDFSNWAYYRRNI